MRCLTKNEQEVRAYKLVKRAYGLLRRCGEVHLNPSGNISDSQYEDGIKRSVQELYDYACLAQKASACYCRSISAQSVFMFVIVSELI